MTSFKHHDHEQGKGNNVGVSSQSCGGVTEPSGHLSLLSTCSSVEMFGENIFVFSLLNDEKDELNLNVSINSKHFTAFNLHYVT